MASGYKLPVGSLAVSANIALGILIGARMQDVPLFNLRSLSIMSVLILSSTLVLMALRRSHKGHQLTSFSRVRSASVLSKQLDGRSRTKLFPWAPARWASSRRELSELGAALGFDAAASETLGLKLQAILSAIRGDEATRKCVRTRPDTGRASESHSDEAQLHEPIDDYAAGRFLLAAKFDTCKAVCNLQEYLSWRQRMATVMAPPPAWLDSGAIHVPFEDRFGRPVVVIRARYFNSGVYQNDVFEQGFCATLDAVIGHLLRQRRNNQSSTGNLLDQYICWIDTSGTGRRNFSLPAVKTMQRLATTRYAERVVKMYVLHPGLTVRTLWGLVKPMLLERTQGNIQMVATADVPQVLRDLMGSDAVDRLPQEYGGSADNWPAPSDARTLEEKAGVLAADAWRMMGAAPAWDSIAHTNTQMPGGRETLSIAESAAVTVAARTWRGAGVLGTTACSPCFAWIRRLLAW